MSIREVNPSSLEVDAIAEVQLQEELRSLFVVDTQNYLQRYSQLTQALLPETWKTDIQELYRCIHTIKGGAVTVAAEAVLQVATALEDLLSDLRYLEVAPSLSDDHLQQALLEAGELLTGVLVQDVVDTEPILHRVQLLHSEVRERYLSHLNPQWQLHQDFAEQGLDMVVLELQIALERLSDESLPDKSLPDESLLDEFLSNEPLPNEPLPDETFVTATTIDAAQQTLSQLQQIGNELQFAPGWADLLHRADELLACPTVAVWQSQWLLLFQALKTCAKQSGHPVNLEWTMPIVPTATNLTIPISFNSVAPDRPTLDSSSSTFDRLTSDGSVPAIDLAEEISFDSLDIDKFLENEFLEDSCLETGQLSAASFTDFTDDSANDSANDSTDDFVENLIDDLIDDLIEKQSAPHPLLPDEPGAKLDEPEQPEMLSFSSVQAWLDLPAPAEGHLFEADLAEVNLAEVNCAEVEAFEPVVSELSAEVSTQKATLDRAPQPVVGSAPVPQTEATTDPANVQIPVSLEKLDRSAQFLVETLLALRSTHGFYQTLQNQITQLVSLAQEGVQSITQLRQIQDDYALLDLQSKQTPQGVNPERYRQGYTVINRLLETNLRLSEIGAEAGKITEQIAENLRTVDGSVLKLQNTIEDSRLVSFQSLGMRARAILRDLVTRYGKPARLIILGEQTELDASTARTLEPVLLHLLRNAYDHGLESPSERMAQGKPEQGTIVLSLRRQGNLFSLEFQDDGRGINAAKIRLRAEASAFPLTQTTTAEDLLQVICQPGFSSEVEANEISGRGVGMDVVATQVNRLSGQLSLKTVLGTGTTFQLQFPAPRLLVPCVLLRAGDYTFAIPEDEIRTITLLGSLNAVQTKQQNGNLNSAPNLSAPYQSNSVHQWQIQNGESSTPALDLLEYWQPHLGGRSLSETAVCLFIQTQSKQPQTHPTLDKNSQMEGVWLLADELLEQAELVINLMPSPLVVPAGVLGVSLQVNGSLVPVLEAQMLAEWLLNLPSQQSESEAIDAAVPEDLVASRLMQTILVVDDAALMRRRLEASLSANGYVIHTCSDGQEAWNWLQEHPSPSLILTDIEMPNMDGFTLIDRCRQTGITVPILVVSSRLSEEWFNEARRLGATDYLTKGFATIDLLSKVNKLLNMASFTVS